MPIYKKSGGSYRTQEIYKKKTNNAYEYQLKNLYKKSNGVYIPIYKYSWDISDWSECSEPCGPGIQTRTVRCKRSDGIFKSDIFCNDIVKPATTQDCNLKSCWVAPSEYRFHYGRYKTGDSRLYIGDGPIGIGFTAYVTDTCSRNATQWLKLELYNNGVYTTIWDSGQIAKSPCDYWSKSLVGQYMIDVPYDGQIYFHAYLAGRDHCCTSIYLNPIYHY
jgi:hypothetical protein